jgi:hypothetical protein
MEGATRVVHPREEGFTDVVYHGTNAEVEGKFRISRGGSFGGGVYSTTDPALATFYAGRRTGGNVHPLLVNGRKILGFAQLNRPWTVAELKNTYKELGLKMPKLTKEALKGLDNEAYVLDTHENIMDVIAREASKKNETLGDSYRGLQDLLEAKGYHGHAVQNNVAGRRVAGVTNDTEVVVYNPDNIKSLFDRTTVQDPSGGFAVIIDVDMPENAFYTHVEGPKQGVIARFVKNSSQTLDENLVGKANVADQKSASMYKKIDNLLREAYSPLRKKERIWAEQVLLKQSNERRWFTREENAVLWERATGKPPREEVLHALDMYHVINDLEFKLRNDGLYRSKVIRGMESVKFSAFDETFDIDAKVHANPKNPPKARVYNISDDIHHVGDKTLSSSELQEYIAKGYQLVHSETGLKLQDGTTVDWFLGRRGDFLTERLRREQLNYVPGGHRIYESNAQVKQASYLTQPDTGSKTLTNPNVFVMAKNIRDARRWADVMNTARIAVKNGEKAEYLDEFVFKAQKGFPTGEEFIEKVDNGLIDKNEPFEALHDRDVPTRYKEKGVDLEAVLGEEALSGTNGYFRTTGRMYYSAKGEHMLDTLGDPAPTLDPFTAQATALYNVTRLSASFGDFKDTAIERWVNKYRPYLNVRESMGPEEARSSYSIFNKATPMEDMDFDLKQQMLGQRESIKRILGFQTELDRNYRHWMRSTSDWILGDSDNKIREKASEAVHWLEDHNPVSFLRGIAFDAKLGMWNVGQWFIQGSTMASALALSPRYGMHGLGTTAPIMAFFFSKGNENVLEQLAKNGAHKLGGFADAAEFKAYVREANKSGFFNLGGSHTMINDLGPERFASSIRNGQQHVREMGRWFFYNVEVMNRLVAHRIAYGEALEKFGAAQWDNHLFQEFMARRAENYSFNMSNASKAWWQTGLMSIPTQFWAYNVRMIEALTGKNFTAAQKLRLLGMQVALSGTSGVPLLAGVVDMATEHYGASSSFKEDDDMVNTMGKVAHRGVADYMIYEMFGADVNIGQRWGTGSWSSDLIRDIFGYSEYNNKTFADMTLGATYSITKSILAPILGSALPIAMNWMSHESGSEPVDMTGEEITKMFRQISTVNHALQAWEIYNYGLYTSSNGKVLANDIPSQDALFSAMGFAPAEMNELTVMSAYNKNRKEMINDASNQISQWRQEALVRPDMYAENTKKVNAFVKFLPPDIRREVLRRSHQKVNPSIYSGIKERFEKTKADEAYLNRLEEGPTE